MSEITVAVAGQPNSGKSTIFNLLTGARQFIANYPGVTVEKKTGTFNYKDNKIILVDLPGTYSLTSYSLEERVARDFLIYEEPNLILNVVDSSNLGRNLNLTLQLLEMDIPMVVVLNMMDIAKSRGIKIDLKQLSQELGVAVVPAIAKKGKGKEEIYETIWKVYNNEKEKVNPFHVDYGDCLESVLISLEDKIAADERFSNYSPRWLAVKLMAGDSEVCKLFN